MGQGTKVPIQEFADCFTGHFVPIILLLTAATFISFNLFPDFHRGIMQWGASFLPWVNPDLTPLTPAFITSTAVAFNKTGTITVGTPTVTDILPASEAD